MQLNVNDDHSVILKLKRQSETVKMSSKSAVEAFSAVKIVCKVLGIFSYEKNSSGYQIGLFINIILLIVQLCLILPVSTYFIKYSTNVNDTAEVLSILIPALLHLGQYFILIFTKPNLAILFGEFEHLIHESMYKID